MYCNQYSDAIQELADGTLGPVRRAELQTHLDTCDACRALAADLQKIRDAAAALDHPAPPNRVWLKVAERLRQEGRVTAGSRSGGRRMALLALAATLVIAVGGSLWFLYSGRAASPATAVTSGPTNPGAQGPTDPGGNAGRGDTVQSIADDLKVAEQHYQSAIGKLEQAAKANDGTIDAQTAAVLSKNLQVIDQAIAESRTALQKEPQSQPARDSLFEALRRKVLLLQDTIALMNEMRKGNSAGAAQIIDANKS
jgi:hypothetical protein